MPYRANRPSTITPPPIIYHYHNSQAQCQSCSPVTPGEMCFNCSQISSILLTPAEVRRLSAFAIAYFSDFSRIEAKLKRKARASLEAKKRAFQLREQQFTDMIVHDRAFHHQFAEIKDLLRARASDAAFQNELNEFYDLFSAKKSPEKDDPIYGNDKEVLIISVAT
ncbi:hypothetical protein OEA41_005320 [Lepraria neglecta]|uniref:Uncharacterized protein n=1 Tax=Lepraria neglecta TaxID=209136 RepID=A0AAD9Z205_9LECA|nr:hypothetical protein OEA41_005320 [Lepraria neglecta]